MRSRTPSITVESCIIFASRRAPPLTLSPGEPMTRCLVMGATGALGSVLVPQLAAGGHRVRVLVRDPGKASFGDDVDVVQGDAMEEVDVETAVHGAEVVYVLIHSLERPDFVAAHRRTATILARRAADAGARQIVYLGGIQPPPDDRRATSAHLSSHAEVARILHAGSVPALVLQASMIIGRGSVSFELLRQLAASPAPWLPVPGWAHSRSRPVAAEDVLHYLRAAAELAQPVTGTFDIAGPETVDYESLVQRCARVTGRPAKVPVPAPLWPKRVAARAAGLATPMPTATLTALFDSLRHDMLPAEPDPATALPAPPHGMTSLDNAIRTASDTALPARATGASFTDERELRCAGTADEVWQRITAVGGQTGWYTWPLVWALRGAIDRVAGGVGGYRGRPPTLTTGDVVDFWTVCHRDDSARTLSLHADMRMPGQTYLVMRVEQRDTGAWYRQTISFTPDGAGGITYWWLQKPVHDLVFGRMARTIARTTSRQGHHRS